jgi:hypothetical protein
MKAERQARRAERKQAAAKKEADRQWWLYTHVGKGIVSLDDGRDIIFAPPVEGTRHDRA